MSMGSGRPKLSAQERMERHRASSESESGTGPGVDLSTLSKVDGAAAFLDSYTSKTFDPKKITIENQMTFLDQAGVGRKWMTSERHADKSFYWGTLRNSQVLILAGIYALVDGSDEKFSDVPRNEFNYRKRFIARFGDAKTADEVNLLMWTGKDFALNSRRLTSERYHSQFTRKVEKSDKNHDIGIVDQDDMPGVSEGMIEQNLVRAVDPYDGNTIDEETGGSGRIMGTD